MERFYELIRLTDDFATPDDVFDLAYKELDDAVYAIMNSPGDIDGKFAVIRLAVDREWDALLPEFLDKVAAELGRAQH